MHPSTNDPSEQQRDQTSDNGFAPANAIEYTTREEQLLAAQREAHEAYIGGIAHDLKNPLTTIMGRVELMKRLLAREQIAPADLQRHLAPLETAVQRLSGLLDAISQAHGGSPQQEENNTVG